MNNRLISLFTLKVLAIFLIFFGCVFLSHGATLKPIHTFGEDILYKPKLVQISDKKIYVTDAGDETLKIFSMDGKLINILCGKGEGPGEVSRLRDFDIVGDRIYVYDSVRMVMNVFRKSDEKFLEFKRLPYNFRICTPISFSTEGNGVFYFATPNIFPGDKLIVSCNRDFKKTGAFLDAVPLFSDQQDFNNNGRKVGAKIYSNVGLVKASREFTVFVYILSNTIHVFNQKGSQTAKYKIPVRSIADTVKLISFGDGRKTLERQLNYDLKVFNGWPYVLSRNDMGQSIIFCLNFSGVKEFCRMGVPLTSFDFHGGNIYGVHDVEGGIFVYEVPHHPLRSSTLIATYSNKSKRRNIFKEIECKLILDKVSK